MTRMWMTDPRYLCRNHLLGEHKELHQAVGSILHNKSLKGHIERGQVEVHNIKNRHEALVIEMKRRGYNHQSPLKEFKDFKAGKIDIIENYKELERRCKECKKLLETKRRKIK